MRARQITIHDQAFIPEMKGRLVIGHAMEMVFTKLD